MPNRVVKVVTGETHALALTRDGEVWGWGGNEHGQLCQGLPNGKFVGKDAPWPVKISFTDKIVQGWAGKIVTIASGTHHILAVDDAGRLLAWGRGTEGQLGQGSNADNSCNLPILISTPRPVKSIAAGNFFSLFILSSSFPQRAPGLFNFTKRATYAAVMSFGINTWASLGLGYYSSNVTLPTTVRALANVNMERVWAGGRMSFMSSQVSSFNPNFKTVNPYHSRRYRSPTAPATATVMASATT